MTAKLEKYFIYIVIVFGICMFVKPVLCPLILGTLFFYIGVSAILFMKKLQKSGIECRGRIASFERGRKGDNTPVVEFRTFNGELVTKTPIIYGSIDLGGFENDSSLLGTEVPVLYDPDDPKSFVLNDGKAFNYFLMVIVILAGLLFIIVSLASLLGYIKINFN